MSDVEKVIYSMYKVSKRHGQKEVLKDITLGYFYGAKIGVLGLNGAGKSSLLKIMAGADTAFEGKVVVAPGYTIGYLEQEPLRDETRTVREIVEEGAGDIVELVKKYNAVNEKFAEPLEQKAMDELLELQAKLLRVIQERKFEKVGSSETVSVDVRIIAATNRDLESMIQDGKFRADLYYRLNVLPLNIPPLRQRKDDIEPLAYYFLQKYSSETKKPFVDFSTPAIKALYSYSWPGNVRELENTIERACILGNPPYINLEDFRINSTFPQMQRDVSDFMNRAVVDTSSCEDKSLKTALTEFKKRYVRTILEQNEWNQTKTAKVLGIQRTYVSKLLSELEIKK